ncbi:disulfide bond formation protein B [Pseudomonas sp. Marseille-Q8238]
MAPANPRTLFFLAVIACLGLIGGALYLEHGVGLEPCPLCIVQRVCVMLFALVCLVAALHGPARLGRRIYGGLTLLIALAGAATAWRQIWLQSVPVDEGDACLPPLEHLIDALSLREVLSLAFHGTSDCTALSWSLYGMSLPEWSLLAFAGMILFSLFQILRRG